MDFRLNGEPRHYDGDPKLSLLQYLREVEGISSAKDGCSPQAACGSCVVQVDGKAILSCVRSMGKLVGAKVTTIEGLGEQLQSVFAQAFAEKSGAQCGYCIPGIVMQAKVLLDEHPQPSREDIQKALRPHLCRCTGYKKIEEAIACAAEALRDNREVVTAPSTGNIGQRHPKYEVEKLVLGQHAYVADLKRPAMLHAALKLSSHPRARVLKIDSSKAAALAGVKRVFTAHDVPGERYTGLIVKDWPLMIAEGEITRYLGDVLAGVVAESEVIARQAVALIEVAYDILEPVSEAQQALLADSPSLHPEGNLLSETKIDRGHAQLAIEEAAYVSSGQYQTQVIEHGFMEPECCLAQPCDGGIQVFSQGQGVYEDQKQIASLLALPLEQVRVTLVSNGGGFGGKEDLTVQGHAALFAYHLQRPVRVALNRDESILMHPKRHPLSMNYTVACDAAGKLTALKARIVGDTGAYASVGMKVLERAAGHATGAYKIPHVDIQAQAVYTNNIPCGAMRGFGVNQVTFALESCLDDLCEQAGFDRWQFRFDNAIGEGDETATGQIIHAGAGLRDTLLAVKQVFQAAKYAGIACGLKNTGIGNGMPDEGKVIIEVLSDKQVVIHHGWTEMGQGVNTMALQFLCQETGLDPDIIKVRVDTAAGAYAGMTTASRATSILGNAIIKAARAFKDDLQSQTLEQLSGKVYEGSWVCDWTTNPAGDHDEIITHYSYSYASQVVVLNDCGQVDTVYAAHDAGKIINPNLFEGQIEGSVHMGLGYALTEALVLERSVPQSTRLRNCGILRAHETPKIVVIGVEVPDPHGPYGAKGVGEIGLVPTAAAVANALYQFDGKRRTSLPLARPSFLR